eukprot:TRINITY_DN3747_c0_g1_i2.p1 TRINITY_DN3747_c0_g1~~TRINITY_DN3747_c0_g1_i2.p1  ORF type:complete len:112 (+),score=28.83 TRINITY_DN3747_c0_g1_i2:223-558(+)
MSTIARSLNNVRERRNYFEFKRCFNNDAMVLLQQHLKDELGGRSISNIKQCEMIAVDTAGILLKLFGYYSEVFVDFVGVLLKLFGNVSSQNFPKSKFCRAGAAIGSESEFL